MVDAQGAVEGLITLEDVVAELLGGVSDEFKSMQVRPIRLSDGRLRIPGSMRVDQAAPLAGAPWRGADETVAVYLARAIGRAAEPGEEFDIDGAHVEIEGVEGDAIASVIFGERPGHDEEDAE